MPNSPDLDEDLRRLGREWFAEVRRRDRAAEPARKPGAAEAVPADTGGGWFDWLFDGDCGDASDDGGDCPD